MVLGRRQLHFTFLVLGLALCEVPAAPQEQLTVVPRSGRTFTGYVDARTDVERLWLRFGESPSTILRPITWEAVASALARKSSVAGGSMACRRCRDANLTGGRRRSRHCSKGARNWRRGTAPPAPLLLPPLRVTSISFDALLANWDADAEPDGLLVTVRPWDAWGRPLPVDGVVEIQLQGAVRRDFHAAPHSRGVVVETLDRWNERLSAAQPAPDGYLFRLPFQSHHPSADSVDARGRVLVRLIAPGHGVFEDAREAVPIRRFAPLDELQLRAAR